MNCLKRKFCSKSNAPNSTASQKLALLSEIFFVQISIFSKLIIKEIDSKNDHSRTFYNVAASFKKHKESSLVNFMKSLQMLSKDIMEAEVKIS